MSNLDNAECILFGAITCYSTKCEILAIFITLKLCVLICAHFRRLGCLGWTTQARWNTTSVRCALSERRCFCAAFCFAVGNLKFFETGTERIDVKSPSLFPDMAYFMSVLQHLNDFVQCSAVVVLRDQHIMVRVC